MSQLCTMEIAWRMNLGGFFFSPKLFRFNCASPSQPGGRCLCLLSPSLYNLILMLCARQCQGTVWSVQLGFGGKKRRRHLNFVTGVVPAMHNAVYPRNCLKNEFRGFFSLLIIVIYLCISIPTWWSLSVSLIIQTVTFQSQFGQFDACALCQVMLRHVPAAEIWEIGNCRQDFSFSCTQQRREGAALGRGFSFQWSCGSSSGEIPLPTDSGSPKTNLVYRRRRNQGM